MENREGARNEIIRKAASLIKRYPYHVADALRASKAFFEYPITEKGLADSVIYSLNHNRIFQKNFAILIASDETGRLNAGLSVEKWYSGSGDIDYGKLGVSSGKTVAKATAGGAQSGGLWGAIAGAAIGLIDAGFQWGTAGKKAKTQDVKDKEKIYAELFQEEGKTNWTPILILGGVLIVGGIVTFFALKD